MLSFLSRHSFLVGLCICLVLAAVYPPLGARGGPLRPEVTTQIAVILIFLIQGLGLPAGEVKRGLLQWRLHVYCQVCIFGVAPVLGWVAVRGLGPLLPEPIASWLAGDLGLGFLYLAILPTTVSTAMVFTAKAGGNLTGSLFNIVVANVAGVFLVPFGVAWLAASATGETISPWPLLGRISLLILLPLVVGQLLRGALADWQKAHKKQLSTVNVWLIFFIVYASLCNAFARDVFAGQGLALGLTAIVGGAGLLVAMMLLTWSAAGWLGFNRADRIAGFFCGHQKTLAAGAPMAASLFADSSFELGIVLLPLLVYHPLQLFAGGILAGKLAVNLHPTVQPRIDPDNH